MSQNTARHIAAALIWPGHTHRRARLRAAADVAAADPPLLVPGVLYLEPAPRRAAFAEVVRALPGHWIANEAPDVLPYDTLPTPPGEALHNVLALDGTPLARSPVARAGDDLVRRSSRLTRQRRRTPPRLSRSLVVVYL